MSLSGAGAVAVGAALGAPCRYLLDRFVQSRHRSVFPWGLVVVNLLGSLILGVISARGGHRLPDALVLGAATGWCGAFTTYSSFGYETVQLARGRRFLMATAHALVTVLGGLAAVALGVVIGGTLMG